MVLCLSHRVPAASLSYLVGQADGNRFLQQLFVCRMGISVLLYLLIRQQGYDFFDIVLYIEARLALGIEGIASFFLLQKVGKSPLERNY